MNTIDETGFNDSPTLTIWRRIEKQRWFATLRDKYLGLNNSRRLASAVGAGIAAILLISGLLHVLFGGIIAIGFIASVLAGLCTMLGALPALVVREVPVRVFNILLGAAAGVMLAATAFSLILPGLAFGDMLWPGRGMFAVACGMIIGALFLDLADRKMPHVHFLSADESRQVSMRKVGLFILAITIHNFPEGLAVGVSFGAGNLNDGIALAIAIGLQNIPEGMAVTFPLLGLGYRPARAVWIGTLTGLVEPVGGLLGVTAVSLFSPILPLAMGFAAGAMLFVISEEIIPETQSKGKARDATYAVMIGFVVMMLLDNMLK
ncbi:MAG: ZIP family metal transporter [Gammaproteobacteria bacterium]